jgi:hypothetical protein
MEMAELVEMLNAERESLGKPTIADMLTAEASRPRAATSEPTPPKTGPELGGAMPSPA